MIRVGVEVDHSGRRLDHDDIPAGGELGWRRVGGNSGQDGRQGCEAADKPRNDRARTTGHRSNLRLITHSELCTWRAESSALL